MPAFNKANVYIAIATQTLELSFISAASENVWKTSTIYDKHDAAGYSQSPLRTIK